MNFQPRRSFSIVADLLPPGVLIPVDLDRQPASGQKKSKT